MFTIFVKRLQLCTRLLYLSVDWQHHPDKDSSDIVVMLHQPIQKEFVEGVLQKENNAVRLLARQQTDQRSLAELFVEGKHIVGVCDAPKVSEVRQLPTALFLLVLQVVPEVRQSLVSELASEYQLAAASC